MSINTLVDLLSNIDIVLGFFDDCHVLDMSSYSPHPRRVSLIWYICLYMYDKISFLQNIPNIYSEFM